MHKINRQGYLGRFGLCDLTLCFHVDKSFGVSSELSITLRMNELCAFFLAISAKILPVAAFHELQVSDGTCAKSRQPHANQGKN